MVSPLTPRCISEAAALIIVTDPEDGPRPPESVLKQLFGLTGAEARLAMALGAGKTLEVAADEFAVTRHTVRGQLRDLFAKTGTGRQAELVRLLSNLGLLR